MTDEQIKKAMAEAGENDDRIDKVIRQVAEDSGMSYHAAAMGVAALVAPENVDV